MSIDDAIVFFPASGASGAASPDAPGGRTGLLKGGEGLPDASPAWGGLTPPTDAFAGLATAAAFGFAEAPQAWAGPDARRPDEVTTPGEAFDFTPSADGETPPDCSGFDGARLAGAPPANGAATLAPRVTASDGAAAAGSEFMLALAAPAAAAALSFAGQTGRAKTVDLAQGFWADAARVMPLGDSNTLGLSNRLPASQLESYRRALWSEITEDRLWIDYVGGRSNGPASLPDLDHQGVSGIRATTVVGHARGLATTHRPDVVLLMLGTNDALNEANAASTVPGELLAIMRSIDAVRPDATFLIAPLPPIDPDAPGFGKRADADDIRAAINAKLPALAAQARSEGVDARFVPMPGLGKGDLYDGIHLTKAGHAKMAAAWYGALDDGLASGDFGGARRSTAGVRDVTGSEASDYLRGDAAANTLSGRAGADRIEGGRGADVLTGGGGSDTFVFRTPGESGDRITDFGASDFIEILAAGFRGGLDPGDSVILRSAATPRAQGGAGQFLYDRDDGRLTWDPDGTGSASAVLIATLSGAPTLGAGDFLVL